MTVESAKEDVQVSKATHEIGAVAPVGDVHEGFIYGGIPPGDDKPIWVSQLSLDVMRHFEAAAWAEEQGGALPTKEQGKYLDTIKDEGAFKNLFNLKNLFSSSGSVSVWLAEPLTYLRSVAWCQRLSDGDQYTRDQNFKLSVLSVRR